MSATRSPWRLLMAFVQAVMLVALTGAGPVHGHAGPSRGGHVHLATAAHAEASAPVHDASADADSASAPCDRTCCGQTCCCHAPLLRGDGPAVAGRRQAERTLTGIRAVAFDSVVPESLPEPPRTFA